jgi:hypothetical protein
MTSISRSDTDCPRMGPRYRECAIIVALLALHALALGFAACRDSITEDEIGHLAAGISHWRSAVFHAYRVNPPLIRLVATLPVRFSGFDIDGEVSSRDPLYRSEFGLGMRMIRQHADTFHSHLRLARFACIPFSLFGACVCYCWARELFGGIAGLTAAALWCLNPTVLGHGHLLTPDVGAASLGALACFSFWRWLRNPTWSLAFYAGVALGLAQLTKFTWILLFGLWPLLWVVWRCGRPPTICGGRRQLGQMALMLGFAIYVVNLGYMFEGTMTRLRDFRFVSRTLQPEPIHDCADKHSIGGNRFAGAWYAGVPIPLPANYLLGIDRQKYDFETGYPSYLRGQWRDRGWWYYYLYALAIKEPLGTWMLLALAGWARMVMRGYDREWREEILVVAPIIAILVLVSSQTGFSHHMRYMLPMYPFAIVWISRIARSFVLGHRRLSTLAIVAAVYSFGSSLFCYPHSLSYFNEAVGGPRRGGEHLLHSNIDWGQDVLYYRRWLYRHADHQPVGLAYSVPMALADIAQVDGPHGWVPPGPGTDGGNEQQPPERTGPLPGWYAIFVGELYAQHGRYAYFRSYEPVERIGYTIFIYHISLEDANRMRAELGLPAVGPSQ